MAVFDDHQPCPALRRWLVPEWEGRAAAWWSPPPGAGWRPPRALRRLVDRATTGPVPQDAAEGSLEVLVVVSSLLEPAVAMPESTWAALRPGGTLVDLASAPRRRPAEWLRPWARTLRLREAAAMRMRRWLDRGAFAPEQWITVEPADVVVTIVRRSI